MCAGLGRKNLINTLLQRGGAVGREEPNRFSGFPSFSRISVVWETAEAVDGLACCLHTPPTQGVNKSRALENSKRWSISLKLDLFMMCGLRSQPTIGGHYV
jgi:hypothetical protein